MKTVDFKKLRLFFIIAFIFIGAAIFLSDPFTNKNETTENLSYSTGEVADAACGTVTIPDEGVALGIPGASKTAGINWVVVGVAVAVINLAGALVVIFLSGDQKD